MEMGTLIVIRYVSIYIRHIRMFTISRWSLTREINQSRIGLTSTGREKKTSFPFNGVSRLDAVFMLVSSRISVITYANNPFSIVCNADHRFIGAVICVAERLIGRMAKSSGRFATYHPRNLLEIFLRNVQKLRNMMSGTACRKEEIKTA